MVRRKRERKRLDPVKEGIPIAKLGAEFEWIDPKLKIGLEAYPTFKRPLGNAEINMALALNMYYDNITGKWQPLDSLSISTVKNLARFYSSNPVDLTVDVYDDLRIDEQHNLKVFDVPSNLLFKPVRLDYTFIPDQFEYFTTTSDDYSFDNISYCIYDVVGSGGQLDFYYVTPDDENILIESITGISGDAIGFIKIIFWNELRVMVLNGGFDSFKVRINLEKRHKYYP